jgi:hypothetical protein
MRRCEVAIAAASIDDDVADARPFGRAHGAGKLLSVASGADLDVESMSNASRRTVDNQCSWCAR